MARRRFFVGEVRGGRAELRGEDAQHLTRVLRAQAGQRFEISDNQAVYLAEISELGKDRVVFQILEAVPESEPAVRITLFAALIKFDRFEWLIEKATELGVEAIIPVEAERSEKGLLEAARKRVERWRRIARESSEQSRRDRLPEVRDPAKLDPRSAAVRLRYVLDEDPAAPPILSALPAGRSSSDSVALLVGPEGGWTAGERSGVVSAGWTPVSLGSQILRTETAAIAALALFSAAWGEYKVK